MKLKGNLDKLIFLSFYNVKRDDIKGYLSGYKKIKRGVGSVV